MKAISRIKCNLFLQSLVGKKLRYFNKFRDWYMYDIEFGEDVLVNIPYDQPRILPQYIIHFSCQLIVSNLNSDYRKFDGDTDRESVMEYVLPLVGQHVTCAKLINKNTILIELETHMLEIIPDFKVEEAWRLFESAGQTPHIICRSNIRLATYK